MRKKRDWSEMSEAEKIRSGSSDAEKRDAEKETRGTRRLMPGVSTSPRLPVLRIGVSASEIMSCDFDSFSISRRTLRSPDRATASKAQSSR